MKAPALLALTLVAATLPAMAEVVPGASLAEVRDALGRPNGEMRLGDRHLVYYAHGTVELVNDAVTRVDLRTAEEQAAILAREERRRGELAERRAAAIAEGTALRDKKLADAAFLAAPVAYQVSFWEEFARLYPDVPCAEPLTIARLKLDEQLEEKSRRQDETRRIAELEARLAQAERAPASYYRVHRPYYGRDEYHEFALWPVKYTYYDAPLPVYTTPTTPVVDGLRGVPLPQSERWNSLRPGLERKDREGRWERHDRGNSEGHRRDWRGADRGRDRRHNRL